MNKLAFISCVLWAIAIICLVIFYGFLLPRMG